MLLTVFLAIVFCAAITLMLIAAVAFIQDIRRRGYWLLSNSRAL